MTDLRTAAQQALEYIEEVDYGPYDSGPVVNALRAALAEPQEPVAWMYTDAYNPKVRFLEWTQQAKGYRGDWVKTPLYTAPPQRKPLTEEEIDRIPCTDGDGSDWDALVRFARAIEAAHGIIDSEIQGDKA